MRSLFFVVFPYIALCIHHLLKTLLKERKALNIKQIPNPEYDEGYRRYLKGVLIRMILGRSGQVRSFNYDMYWLLLK